MKFEFSAVSFNPDTYYSFKQLLTKATHKMEDIIGSFFNKNSCPAWQDIISFLNNIDSDDARQVLNDLNTGKYNTNDTSHWQALEDKMRAIELLQKKKSSSGSSPKSFFPRS